MRSVVSHEDFEEIQSCFERKRLERQITYLEDRASTATERNALIKRLPSVLFLTSLVFATLHLLLEFTDFASKWLHEFIPRVGEVGWGQSRL